MSAPFYGIQMIWWYGVVIDTDGSGGVASDPMELGRALVRIYGVHGDEILDQDLPWATVIVPSTEGGVSGIGRNPQLKPGARVIGFFLDGNRKQLPVIWGSIPQVEGTIVGFRATGGGIAGGAGQYGPEYGQSGQYNYGGPTGATTTAPGYPPDMSTADIEAIIIEEAKLRGIDTNVALEVFHREGAGAYQSTNTKGSSKMIRLNGKEASFGPYQLYLGGMGDEYQRDTGRSLPTDNTWEGITKQIQYALDKAATGGWGPWYGYKGGHWDGLSGAQPVGNWR